MVDTITLKYRNGSYYVNKYGDQDGEYVKLEDYAALEAANAALRAEVERLRGALEQVLNSGSIRESERIAQAALAAYKAQQGEG